MKRIARAEDHLLNLNIELILIICSKLLRDDFVAFTNFFQVWFVYKSEGEIFNLLHHLDWSHMHIHHLDWNRVVRERFNLFLTKCNEMRVLHAISYNACRNLFLNQQVVDNMYLIEILANHDDFSYFALKCFNPLFNVNTFQASAEALYLTFQKKPIFNEKIEEFALTMTGRLKVSRSSWEQTVVQLPDFPTCPQYRRGSEAHFAPYGWPCKLERFRKSNCPHCFFHMLIEIIFDYYTTA